MGKIWEERERQRKGLPPLTSTTGKGKKVGGKAGTGEKKGGLGAGQTTLSFAKVAPPPKKGAAPKESVPATKGKGSKLKNGYETEDSGEEDIVVVGSEEEEEPEPKFVPSSNYKKRRIAVASDEEDE